jgi:hypothetical protein
VIRRFLGIAEGLVDWGSHSAGLLACISILRVCFGTPSASTDVRVFFVLDIWVSAWKTVLFGGWAGKVAVDLLYDCNDTVCVGYDYVAMCYECTRLPCIDQYERII